MLSLNVRTPVHENNHTSHRVQDPSLIRILSQQTGSRIQKADLFPDKSKSQVRSVTFILHSFITAHQLQRSSQAASVSKDDKSLSQTGIGDSFDTYAENGLKINVFEQTQVAAACQSWRN